MSILPIASWIFGLPTWLTQATESTGWTDDVMKQVETEYRRGGLSKRQYRDICNHYEIDVRGHIGDTVYHTGGQVEYDGSGDYAGK